MKLSSFRQKAVFLIPILVFVVAFDSFSTGFHILPESVLAFFQGVLFVAVPAILLGVLSRKFQLTFEDGRFQLEMNENKPKKFLAVVKN